MYFCSSWVVVLKMDIIQKAHLRFLPNYTIMITYDQSLIFTWFFCNSGYHSNDYRFLLFLNKPDLLVIQIDSWYSFFYMLKCSGLTTRS